MLAVILSEKVQNLWFVLKSDRNTPRCAGPVLSGQRNIVRELKITQ